jgi:AcrR family transcriptional regulator
MDVSLSVERDRARANPGARRKRALAAARAIASESGYEALTMHEVARRSGVSRATLYRYFSSKDHLLMEVSLDFSAEILKQAEASGPTGATPAERVAYPFVLNLEAIGREPRLFDSTLRAYFSRDPVVRRLAGDLRRLGASYVYAGLGEDDPRAAEIARVLDPLSLAMAVRISSERSTVEEAVQEFRTAVRLLLKA